MVRLLQKSILLVFIAFLIGCGKEEENYEAKIVSDKVETTGTTATFQWVVDYPGKVYSSVELSENQDMSDAQAYGTGEMSEDKHFEVTVDGLKGATEYYYRYKVWNSFNVEQPFVFETKRLVTSLGLPTVVTLEVQGITICSAECGGEVSGDGGLAVTARGLCWGRQPNPSLTENDHYSVDGMGTGSFTTHITDLEPETKYYVRAYATNGKGTSYGNEQEFTTQMRTFDVNTLEVTEVNTESALVRCNVVGDEDNEITERGVCWDKQENPTIGGSHMNNGSGLGTYECLITGLNDNTAYYVRAYAKNADGYVVYGEELNFITVEIGILEVTTVRMTEIYGTTATCLGNVVSSEYAVVQKGACWSTSPTPTINGNHAETGEGTGDFTVELTGLSIMTTYYVRAYAVNTIGRVYYGEELVFTTDNGIYEPTVSTGSVINITYHSAQVSGNVTDDGGATVTEKGICWSTSTDPTINDDHAVYGTGVGVFWLNIDGLSAETQYYARAYAINSEGISYGEWVSFTTLSHPK